MNTVAKACLLALVLVPNGVAAASPTADETGGNPLGSVGSLLPFALMFAVFYFLMIRPASKQRKQHQAMLNALKKDDEVVTTGGIYGRIVGIDDKVATLEVSDRVKIRILRDRIAGKWAAGDATQHGGGDR